MNDLQQVDPAPISAKTLTITLLATSILGFAVALTAWSLLLTTSQAIAVVSIGRYDQTQYSFIEEPQSVIERIKSPNFVAAASARVGIPELSALLPARQYGGSGALAARSLRDPNLIEIRINLTQPELALKAVTAVVDELIADHEAKAGPLIQNFQSTLTVLDKHASEMVKAGDTISRLVGGSPQSGETGQDGAALLSARALTESGFGALVRSAIELRTLTSNIRKTQIIAAPTVTTPKTTSLYQTVTAGAVAGLLAGLLLLQMFPGFFRTGPTRLEVSRPSPP
jgi:hypothetical protein